MTHHEQLTDATKHIIDGASVLTVLGTLAQVLPPLARSEEHTSELQSH